MIFYLGQGVPQDYAQALKLFNKAAELGYSKAQRFLGLMFYLGHGVPQDFVLAHKWLNLAASRATGLDLDISVKTRNIIASEMTPQQIADAQRLAREWKQKKEGN